MPNLVDNLKRFAHSGDMIWSALAAWLHETNRLPTQRPRSARPPGVRTHPHAGRRAICRWPLPSPGRPPARRRPPERQPLARPLASGRAARAAQRRPHRVGPAIVGPQLAAIDQALRQGARAHGFDTDHWTLARITTVIQQLTGVSYHSGHTWKLLRRRLGWRLQRPARRAVERDEQAIARWVAEDWP